MAADPISSLLDSMCLRWNGAKQLSVNLQNEIGGLLDKNASNDCASVVESADKSAQLCEMLKERFSKPPVKFDEKEKLQDYLDCLRMFEIQPPAAKETAKDIKVSSDVCAKCKNTINGKVVTPRSPQTPMRQGVISPKKVLNFDRHVHFAPSDAESPDSNSGNESECIASISEQELRSVPKYMIGRLTSAEINTIVEAYNNVGVFIATQVCLLQTINSKYTMMEQKLSALPKSDKTRVVAWREQQKQANVSGCVFITDKELKAALPARDAARIMKVLPVLRHLKRIKEVRGGSMCRIVAL